MVDEVMNAAPNDGRAPLMAHLKELRNRIMYSAVSLGVGLLIGMFFGSPIIRLLQKPGGDMGLITKTVMEPMAVYFQISMLTAVMLAMPFLVFQLMAFVAPGLTSKEKRVVFSILPGIIFMFLGGMAFAYFIALHPALTFLYHFNNTIASAMPSLSTYINFVVRVLLIFGLVFETPLIVMALAKLGVVSPDWLASKRKWWILLAFIIAAVVTPTPDPVNQTIVAVPLILLLELGILLSRLVYKKKRVWVPDSE
jgi:sec-independent protein translocase protein TatC